jgi:hypothetical protein
MLFNNNSIDDNRFNFKYPLIIAAVIIFLIMIIFFITRTGNKNISLEDKLYYIELKGDNKVTVYLGEKYIEPGYKGTDESGKDVTSNIIVVNEVDSNSLGTYKIEYTLGNITKERIVSVVEKPVGATYIHLNGDVTIFLYVGEEYIEKGYEVIDSVDGAKLNKNVKINSNVDTSKEGIYKVIYSVINSSGVTTTSERKVIVTSHDLSIIPSTTDSTNKNVIINIYVKDELFDYLVLPNNKKVTDRVANYEVDKNGTYKFTMYNKKGETTEKSIEITNIDKENPQGSCSGYYQNGVSYININANDNVGISRYMINGTSYIENSIKINKELSSVNITIYDKAGNSKDISCNLTSKNYNNTTATTTRTTGITTTTKTTVATTKQSLNISSSFNDYNAAGYSLYIPENATVDMPLFVMVSPSSKGHYDIKKVFNNWHLEKIPAFIMIAHNMTNYTQIRNNIDNVVAKYKIDKSRISVSGFSSSGTYVYYLLAKNKDLFSGLVVVSSGMTCNYDVIKNNRSYFETLPTIGFGETGGQYDANGRKCSGYTNWSPSGHMKPLFSCLGISDKFTDLGKICHSQVTSYVFNIDNNKDNKSDVIEWAISQTKK